MKETLDYLRELHKNNNRIWFQKNKLIYEQSYLKMQEFADSLMDEMSSHDYLETISAKKSLFRIYRDVRFGKDKTPYKTHWGGFLKRAGAENRGGYYYHISPKSTYIMGGFFSPNKDDLLHIRKHLEQETEPLRDILKSREFKSFFGELGGTQLKTAPRGFDKEHPDVDLLRYKQFLVRHDFTDKEVIRKDFPQILSNSFRQMRPFFDQMSEMLSTDLNGQRLF